MVVVLPTVGVSAYLRPHRPCPTRPKDLLNMPNASEPSTLELFPSRELEHPGGTSGEASRRKAGLHTVGLFAGIGGIELGLERSGHRTIEFCELDDAAVAVLKTRFENVPVQRDVKDYTDLPASTELVTAGFPCQDLSQAGKTLGMEGARSGLVEEIFWLLRRQSVPWVLLENVSFMLRLRRGHAMEKIVTTFEELGYNWAYRTVDTRAFGLPQRRKRVFILASLDRDPREVMLVDSREPPEERFEPDGAACGFYWTEGNRGLGWAVDAVPTLKGGSSVGIPSPPAIWLPDGRIIKPSIRDAERLQGFPPGWTEPAEDVDRASIRWRLVGNAVSVDVAQWIGQRLREPGKFREWGDRRLVPGQKWPSAAYNVGRGRFSSGVSEFPIESDSSSLLDFIDSDSGKLLSLRATTGFLNRFEASALSRPPGFLEALRAHRQSMVRQETTVGEG